MSTAFGPLWSSVGRGWGGELTPFLSLFPRNLRDLAVMSKHSIARQRRSEASPGPSGR